MAEIASPPPLSLRTQILRFVLTGGFSALVDYGLLELLSTTVGQPTLDIRCRAQPIQVREGDGALRPDIRSPGRPISRCLQ